MSGPEPPDRLRDILGDKSPEEFAAEDERRLEWAVVDYILGRYGRTSARQAIRRADNDGYYGTFRGFSEVFPEFPVYLFVRKYGKLSQRLRIHSLFEKLPDSEFYQEFVELQDELPDGFENYGVAFFWPYLRARKTKQGGLLVLHNCGYDNNGVDGTRLSHTFQGVTLVLEPLPSLLDVMDREHGHDWCNSNA